MWKRLAALFRRNCLDRELAEEIATHLAMQEEVFRRQGMSPEAACAAARREFGGVAQTMESYRDRRGIRWIETALCDVRYSIRGLTRNPGFAVAAILSLALGIGANTAIFSLYHAIMLRMLPVANPQQLVSLYRTGAWGRGYGSYPLFLELRKRTDLFQDVAARSGVEKVRISGASSDRTETAQREMVSGNYFRMLGVAPAIGRVFTDDDNRTPHAHPIAVLSYDFWRTRFGGDPAVLGRSLTVGEQPLTIVGVAGQGFQGVEVDHRTDLWEPAMMSSGEIMDPGMHWVWMLARRRPEVSTARIQAAVDVFFPRYLASIYGANPNSGFRRTAIAQHIEVRDGAIGLSLLREQFGKALTILMATVGLVLLAACANVANLLLARGAARSKEMALRISLGAARGRLLRQALMESVILAFLGAGAGVLFALWGTQVLLGYLPGESGDASLARPDGAVFGYTALISIVSAIVFGLAPALRSTALDPAEALHAPGVAGGRSPGLRRMVVILQVSLSVVLVVVAALFGGSLSAVRAVDPGFRNQSVTSFLLDFPTSWKPAETASVRRRFIDRLEALPGVTLVSYGFPGPFLGGYSSMSVQIPGSPLASKDPLWVSVQNVGPHYFEILGTSPLSGRGFERGEFTSSPKVVVVNEAFLRKYLPGEPHVLGQLLRLGDREISIVGVVRDMRHNGLREKVDPTVYLPLAMDSVQWEPSFLIRSDLPAAALSAAVRTELGKLGPQIAFSQPKTIQREIDESIYRERLLATLGGLFGLLALILAAIGLYGLVSYDAARRASEMAIRVALGARRRTILWIVLRDALVLVSGGLVMGLPLALVTGKRVSGMLSAVPEAGFNTLAVTAAILVLVATAAALLPARRAAALDPMRLLRSE